MIRCDRSAYDRIVSIESLSIENLNIDCENIEILSLRDLSQKDLFHFRFSKIVSTCPSKKWHFLQATFSMELMVILKMFLIDKLLFE